MNLPNIIKVITDRWPVPSGLPPGVPAHHHALRITTNALSGDVPDQHWRRRPDDLFAFG